MGMTEEILGNHGAPHTLTHGGKTYRVKLIDQAVKTAFSRGLLARAREASRELKELMTPAEWAAHLLRTTEEYVQGGYSIFSPRGLAFLNTEDGVTTLGPLLFGCEPPEFWALFRARKEEVESLLRLVFYESFGGESVAGDEGKSPNPPGPRPEVIPAGA